MSPPPKLIMPIWKNRRKIAASEADAGGVVVCTDSGAVNSGHAPLGGTPRCLARRSRRAANGTLRPGRRFCRFVGHQSRANVGQRVDDGLTQFGTDVGKPEAQNRATDLAQTVE